MNRGSLLDCKEKRNFEPDRLSKLRIAPCICYKGDSPSAFCGKEWLIASQARIKIPLRKNYIHTNRFIEISGIKYET